MGTILPRGISLKNSLMRNGMPPGGSIYSLLDKSLYLNCNVLLKRQILCQGLKWCRSEWTVKTFDPPLPTPLQIKIPSALIMDPRGWVPEFEIVIEATKTCPNCVETDFALRIMRLWAWNKGKAGGVESELLHIFVCACVCRIYSVFHRFRKAKFANGGWILSSSQFSILPQLAQKMTLASKVVKINSK